jgi:FAD/FMN-containing dehydrogenase
MEVVTADGEVITVSADKHPDLFWAMRGGGGNFGIVTRFVFEAVSVPETLSGALIMPLTADNLRGVLALADEAPEELTTITEIMAAPPAPFIPEELVGTPVMFVLMVWAGDPAQGQPVVDRFRAVATPIADMVGPMPYGGIYEFSAEAENPQAAVTRSMFADMLDDATIEAIVANLNDPERPEFPITQVRVLGGEMGRVAADATAFAHRGARTMVTIYSLFQSPETVESDIAWTDVAFGRLAHASTGVYVNFLDREGQARIRHAYPEATYRRLAAVKRHWDPDNILHRNQNVRPD